MSRAQHDTRVYALFDVPGTGFRDREGTGMHVQYHKVGWQKDFKSEDSPENQYDATHNPVVILGLGPDASVGSIMDACEKAFGTVSRMHRPKRVRVYPEDEDEKNALFEPFAIVEFADDDAARKAAEAGYVSIDAHSVPVDATGVRDEEPRGSNPQGDPNATDPAIAVPSRNHPVVSRKLLSKDLCAWRNAIRAKFKKASAARKPFRNVGPSEDPTEWCNAGNNFKSRYPEFCVER
jgi:hypothetical protein